MKKENIKILIISLVILGTSISVQSLLAAWLAPTAPPPGANVEKPINTGPDNQQKLGSLDIAGDISIGGTVYASTTFRSLAGDMNLNAGSNGMEFNISTDGSNDDDFIFKVNGIPVSKIDTNGDFYTGDVISNGERLITETDVQNNYYTKVEVDNAISLGGGGSGGTTAFDLFNGEHSSSQCIDNGGNVVDMGIGKFCRFDEAPGINEWGSNVILPPQCPALWAQYENMTETEGGNTCTGTQQHCGCNPTSCTVPTGHSFSIALQEKCNYFPGHCNSWGSGCAPGECVAKIKSIGCY